MILVCGATGSIGHYVVHDLSQVRANFKVLVRTPSQGDALGTRYVVADFDRPETLEPALSGMTKLFLNGPVGPGMVRQQTNVIRAAQAAGVHHVVRVSAAGANLTSDRAVNRWHGEIDMALLASGMRWNLLRPTIFTQVLLQSAATISAGSRFYGGFGQGRLAFIDCRDIAACGAVLLHHDQFPDVAYYLTGPGTVSFPEIAGKLSARLKRPVQYINRPVDELVAQMIDRGMSVELADSFGKMMASFGNGEAATVTSAVKDLLGRPAKTVDQFLDLHINAFT